MAGASLAPSPVTATTRPACFNARTMETLSAGLTRANTVVRAVDAVQERAHEVRVEMKSVICSSSSAPSGAARRRASRALRCDSAAIERAPSSP